MIVAVYDCRRRYVVMRGGWPAVVYRPSLIGVDHCGGWEENGNNGIVEWRAKTIEAWRVSVSVD